MELNMTNEEFANRLRSVFEDLLREANGDIDDDDSEDDEEYD